MQAVYVERGLLFCDFKRCSFVGKCSIHVLFLELHAPSLASVVPESACVDQDPVQVRVLGISGALNPKPQPL